MFENEPLKLNFWQPEPVNERMIQLKKKGTSNGAIIEHIFDEFQISLSRGRLKNWPKALQAFSTKH